MINSIGKYFRNVSENSIFFSGLNFNSSIKLKMQMFKAQLNKLPTKFKKLVIVILKKFFFYKKILMID